MTSTAWRAASRRGVIAVAAVGIGVAAALALLAPPAADAQVTGGCSATIAGQDLDAARSVRTAIEVDLDQTIVVAGTAPGPITGYHVYLTIAGLRFEAASGEVTDNSTSYVTEIDVADYARLGGGSYRVEAETTGTACTSWAYVRVSDGFPLFTAAGAVGATLTVAGGAGLVHAAFRARAPRGV